ncbi:MAG: efflux RND transporter periplasmic adaptor subunit [Clostridia bacterium]|nr:efflux RND transporter periplasmic adaptor subunit [Clostridia bacterium]
MNVKTKPKKRRVVRRIVWTLIVLLVLGGVGWTVYNSLKAEYTVTYDTYTATTGSISNALSFSGNLNLVDSETYTAASTGTVRTIYVSAGDEVKEDDKLLRLNNGDTVTAGFDGRVNKLNVREGDEVTVGEELVQIADFRHMKVSFRVDEYDIGDVTVGQACTATVTALEKQFETAIDAIDYISSSSGNVAYYTATASLDVDDAYVLPGMQVTVSITQEEAQDVVILKVDALSFDETNQAFVWVKDDSGALEKRTVTTGVSNGNYIEITEGLSDGDEVYVEAKATETASKGLLGGLFGGAQFNQPQGGPGGMPGGGSMPDFANGERPSFSDRGGDRPSFGGGN